MRADNAYQLIEDIHRAVMSGAVELDAASQIRMLEMLNKGATEMVQEQRNNGGDPCATKWYAHGVAEALEYAPSAIEEMSADIQAAYAQRAVVARAARAAGWSTEFESGLRVSA